MANSKKKDMVISNKADFDQTEYDKAVGKLIRSYKKAKEILQRIRYRSGRHRE